MCGLCAGGVESLFHTHVRVPVAAARDVTVRGWGRHRRARDPRFPRRQCGDDNAPQRTDSIKSIVQYGVYAQSAEAIRLLPSASGFALLVDRARLPRDVRLGIADLNPLCNFLRALIVVCYQAASKSISHLAEAPRR